MISPNIKQRIRRAVTLVEVIFAIGVILIGLLGLLSILPLAGKRAQDSVSLSTGPQIANRVLAELKSHRFYSNFRLVRFEDLQDAEKLKEPDPPNPLIASRMLPNFTANIGQAFCIDPLYVHNDLNWSGVNLDLLVPPNSLRTIPTAKKVGGYDGSNFPSYSQYYEPTENPSESNNRTTQLHQMMHRVGILSHPISSASSRWISLGSARELTQNQDDLLNVRVDDQSMPARLDDISKGTVVPLGLEYGKRIPSGEFSWLVTVSPLPDGVYANVAVVVLRNRTNEFDYPEDVDSPSQNLTGERLARVTSYRGFQGGSGGIVQLEASKSVNSDLVPGDWLMLSAPGLGSNPLADHRWYRVASLVNAPQELGQVWQQQVLLDGPDRNDVSPPTFATLISGVVSVTETVLKLSEI